MQSGDWKGLVQAIIDGDIAEVRYYLNEAYELNYSHPEIMTTPLIEACRYENLEIVKMLLEKGASPKFESQLKESPIRIAKQSKNEALLRLLRDQ